MCSNAGDPPPLLSPCASLRRSAGPPLHASVCRPGAGSARNSTGPSVPGLATCAQVRWPGTRPRAAARCPCAAGLAVCPPAAGGPVSPRRAPDLRPGTVGRGLRLSATSGPRVAAHGLGHQPRVGVTDRGRRRAAPAAPAMHVTAPSRRRDLHAELACFRRLSHINTKD